jgi:hypothetical protein
MMAPSFEIPLAVMLSGGPAILPGVAEPLLRIDLAALAPLLLGAVLWSVLLAAMQAVREENASAPDAPVGSVERSRDIPAAA